MTCFEWREFEIKPGDVGFVTYRYGGKLKRIFGKLKKEGNNIIRERIGDGDIKCINYKMIVRVNFSNGNLGNVYGKFML